MGYCKIYQTHEKRLSEKPHSCNAETVVYKYGTHFVFPEGMMNTMLPVGSGLFVRLAFSSAKKHPDECRNTRIDIDRRITKAIAEWKK